ncbi:hypothetical protein TIFTF001_003956 [Ficus carica]|uniref:Uncharacterized protein n=1 Tax=Ficus carica TaxID=3494 RepID=A0AA88CSG4_FICCA|nr:hypothetical protein TIFTF001_003956 [Ficus carica]
MKKKATLTSVDSQANRQKAVEKKGDNRGLYFRPRRGEIKRRIFASFVDNMKKMIPKCVCFSWSTAKDTTKP